MATLKWLFVNLFSLSRVPLSYLCCQEAWQKQWLEAFIYFSAVIFSDVADGPLAGLLKSKTNFGKVLDKFCDVISVALGGLGLRYGLVIITDSLKLGCSPTWNFWHLYFILAALQVFFWIFISTFPEKNKFRLICRVASSVYTMTLMIVIDTCYAALAFDLEFRWLFCSVIFFALIAACLKWQRLKDLLNGLG